MAVTEYVSALADAGRHRRPAQRLAALDIADLTFTAEGVQVEVRTSKTDRDSDGRTVCLPEWSCEFLITSCAVTLPLLTCGERMVSATRVVHTILGASWP
ncbi:hypothetical protein AB0F72_32630 [Actinoplanes sp. NPDC023936]|uniref:hypothetical protein n=1 Tax=Actinoplanes sp. NPDC023936 TaxID=3154910 RepID=UPI00340B1715